MEFIAADQQDRDANSAGPDAAAQCPRGRGRGWWGWLVRGLFVAFMLVVASLGVQYRNWAWDYTSVARYQFDINRNYDFGIIALDKGYLDLYEDQVRDNPPYERKIDYPPLRLATFEAWAQWTRWTHPGVQQWQPDYQFNWFLIQFNTLMGLISASAAFLIVRHWLRVCAQAHLPPDAQISPWTGIVRATIAFALLCFDPGIAIIGHGWPSPNLWVIPMYLLAVLFCLYERWFVAGVVLGIGAMMQGQQLLAAAIFILWPLLSGQPMRALRWLAGFIFASGLITSGWMLTLRPEITQPGRVMNWPAVLWVSASVLLLAAVGLRKTFTSRKAGWCFALPAAGAIVVLTWPACRLGWVAAMITLAASAGLVWAFWTRTWALKRYLLPLVAGGCLLLCMLFWGGSTAWWKIGFMYGTERFQNVGGGNLVNNLPTILAPIFRWDNVHEIAWQIPPHLLFGLPREPVPVEVRHILLSIFGTTVLAAAYAMAKHWRKRDPALLVALALPWVLFYTLLPQMSPRYAVFVAGIGMLCVGRSLFLIPAIWLFSFLTVEQTALCMTAPIGGDPNAANHLLFGHAARQLYYTLNPGLSWAVVVVAAMLFVVAMKRTPHTANG